MISFFLLYDFFQVIQINEINHWRQIFPQNANNLLLKYKNIFLQIIGHLDNVISFDLLHVNMMFNFLLDYLAKNKKYKLIIMTRSKSTLFYFDRAKLWTYFT